MYQLAPHVFACTTGRNCMFLDLRKDAYLSVPRALIGALAPQIHGWQLPVDPCDSRVEAGVDPSELADDLIAAGILCPLQRGADARPQLPPLASRDFTSLRNSRFRAGFHRFGIGALTALASADYALRRVPLWRIVTRISSRAPRVEASFEPERLSRTAALVGCFRAVRPWYPRDYLCLFDSLALTLFLLHRGIHARWIFGVREDPFAAHCWVQYGGAVLNEFLDRTRPYTVIMAV